jgi:hypothetical protein
VEIGAPAATAIGNPIKNPDTIRAW